MSRIGSDQAWERIGRADPYFGVLSSPQFHQERFDDAAREAFFASGSAHIADVLQTVRLHLDRSFKPRRALDFGCGVGRLLMPLCRECDEVVGLDVSPSMLEMARRNLEASGCHNVRLVQSDDGLAEVEGTFDLIHSYIVFQHIPVARGEALTDALLRRLSPGGVAVLHYPYDRTASKTRKAVNWARRTIPGANALVNVVQGRNPSSPLYQMNTYDLHRLYRLLEKHELRGVFTRLLRNGEYHGVVLHAQRSYTANPA
ncbi:MAG TPA: class I SAM-dependent methyltransferase [Gemmatimonadales bacterium]|nr:class I SAM-dependent methyltransferase [Gemmatimonadales bacterium]